MHLQASNARPGEEMSHQQNYAVAWHWSSTRWTLLRKIQNDFSPRKWLNRKTNGTIRKCAPRPLRSCHYVSTILNFLGSFCVPPLVTVQKELKWPQRSLTTDHWVTSCTVYSRRVSNIVQFPQRHRRCINPSSACAHGFYLVDSQHCLSVPNFCQYLIKINHGPQHRSNTLYKSGKFATWRILALSENAFGGRRVFRNDG
jgi:hypothetical protein